MIKCRECGKPTSKSYSGMCQGCYKYFHEGGKVHTLPPPGRIEHDSEGKVICHICGRSYTRLGSHIRESHNLTIAEYKEQFGLCANSKTTESHYSLVMHEYAIKNKMPERIIEVGKGTRIQKGDSTMRKGKNVRLQEILDKRNRRFKK